jgi:antitoxin (DNA-binding transcriptional repressor) of toxin-antitoxin stability system
MHTIMDIKKNNLFILRQLVQKVKAGEPLNITVTQSIARNSPIYALGNPTTPVAFTQTNQNVDVSIRLHSPIKPYEEKEKDAKSWSLFR